jgi:hypothetical protein
VEITCLFLFCVTCDEMRTRRLGIRWAAWSVSFSLSLSLSSVGLGVCGGGGIGVSVAVFSTHTHLPMSAPGVLCGWMGY